MSHPLERSYDGIIVGVLSAQRGAGSYVAYALIAQPNSGAASPTKTM